MRRSRFRNMPRPSRASVRSKAVPASILFVDMAASSFLKLVDDVWIWQENIYTLHTRASNIVCECNGTVSKTIGDSVMAFFSGPKHEEDVLWSALALLCSFENLYEYFHIDASDTLWQFRITLGVASGDVYFLYRNDPYGPAVDLAARLQATASGGTGLLYSGTVKRIEGTELHRELAAYLGPEEVVSTKGFGDVPVLRMTPSPNQTLDRTGMTMVTTRERPCAGRSAPDRHPGTDWSRG